jgi:hypothetical protein
MRGRESICTIQHIIISQHLTDGREERGREGREGEEKEDLRSDCPLVACGIVCLGSSKVLPTAYVSISHHMSAYVSIRQVLGSYASEAARSCRQHTSAYVIICQHTSAYVRFWDRMPRKQQGTADTPRPVVCVLHMLTYADVC